MKGSFALIKAVQSALIAKGYDLGAAGADGIAGRRTQEALMSPGVTLALSEAVAKAGIPEFTVVRRAGWLNERELQAAIDTASLRFQELGHPMAENLISAMSKGGFSPSAYLAYIVKFEASVPARGFVDANSVSPSGLHFGLAQIGVPAWQDASEIDPAVGRPLRSSDLREYAFNPVLNLYTALLVAAKNWSYTLDKSANRKIREPVLSNALLYFMHNLGHTVVTSLAKGQVSRHPYFNGQSEKAKSEYYSHAQRLQKELAYG